MSKIKKKPEKKQIVKIPNNIKVFYCKRKKILILKGIAKQKSLKINNLLTINCYKQQIEIINSIDKNFSNIEKKKNTNDQKHNYFTYKTTRN